MGDRNVLLAPLGQPEKAMGHESRIEPGSPHLTTCCFASFGTDKLRCEEAMKTAGRENPNRWANMPSNRAHGTAVQNRSCSMKWAATQENVQPLETCLLRILPIVSPHPVQPNREFSGHGHLGNSFLAAHHQVHIATSPVAVNNHSLLGSREPALLSRWEKLGRGGTEDETVKPLDGVQRVQVPHGQSEQAGR
jgi:hypothetical protein